MMFAVTLLPYAIHYERLLYLGLRRGAGRAFSALGRDSNRTAATSTCPKYSNSYLSRLFISPC
jgi:hypothetical protein